MKKIKTKILKMFDFHTAVILVVTVILLLSCTAQGRVEASNKQQQQYNNHHNHHHQHHHHYDIDEKPHHHQHRKNHHHQHTTTPSIESTTTNNPASSNGDVDNESTFKMDEELYRTITMNALTSTTSTPSQHHSNNHQQHQLEKPLSNQRNGQHLILNTSSISASPSAAVSNSIVEHHTQQPPTQPQPQDESRPRLVPTPLQPHQSYSLSATTQQYNHNGGGNQRRSSFTSTNPLERSKYSSYTDAMERDNYMFHRPPGRSQYPQQHHPAKQQEYNYDLRQHQLHKSEEDYYEEYNEDDDDDDEDDIDGFVDDTDNNLSDRSYARITRSKLDDDYADDEPYRNAVEDEMQRDATPGALTEHKYLDVGNEKAVQQARERYIQEQKRPKTPHELATEHWQRMIHATKCRKPLPRVIPVSNNTSKRYEPYATILHRCGEDTGCCGSTASVCTVKRYEIVMVYVFSYDFNYRKEIEALPMQNHTECHCVNRATLQQDAAPRGKRSGQSWQQHLRLQHNQKQLPSMHHGRSQSQVLLHRSDMKAQHQHSENELSCHCPRHFSVFEVDVERYAHLPRPHTVFTRKCRCDCQPNNQTCLRFKQGEEGFSLEDRRCIMEHSCKLPICSFGDYDIQSGRCPPYRANSKEMF